MIKKIAWIFCLLYLVGVAYGFPIERSQAATCDLSNIYCVPEVTTFWHYCTSTDQYGNTSTWSCPYTATICTVPQANGTTCKCCYDGGGCYLNCPGVTPTPNGGGPGNTNAPPPTLPPGTIPPTPQSFGTINARAVQVTPNDTSCTAIRAVPITDGQINNETIQFTPSSASNPSPVLQSGANYVSEYLITGSYTLDPVPPNANWVPARNCWSSSNGLSGEGFATTLGANETVTYDIGYTLGTPWVQTGGGDVYASGTIRSFIPAVAPRVFNTDGTTGGYPGVVTYGTGIDLDALSSSQGTNIVSSKKWLVNTSRSTVDYYDLFYHRFNAPTETDNALFGNLTSVDKPATRATPYYITGDMITAASGWTINTTDSIIFIVNGNLTIGGPIRINGKGFVAFIVNGNITVASTVGTTSLSTTPVVEGIYITSPTGTFMTGTSTAPATSRFVGKGMFIAGNFLLQRDLEGFGSGNTASSAELFTYNPTLFFTMPDPMKELPVTWQEVAP